MRTKREQVVINLLDKWKPRLLLDHWAIMTHFAEDDLDMESNYEVLARVVVNSTYTEAKITVYPCFFKQPKGNQATTIIHELCHLHTERIRTALRTSKISEKQKVDLVESLTESIAKMFAKTYSRGRKSAKYHL